MKINPKKLGLSIGLVWGVMVFIFTLIAAATDFGYLTLINLSIYPWYTISVPGAFAGLFWGFIDGLVGGYLLGWVYNKLPIK